MNPQANQTTTAEPDEEIVSKLAAALSKAQAEYEPIVKDKTANAGTYKYQYSDLADVIDATKVANAKYGLAHSQQPTFRDNAFVLVTELMHVSGERRECMWPLAVGKPQDMGSALTYARRYSLCAILGIVAEQDDDGAAGGNAQVQQPQRQQPQQQRPEPPKQNGKQEPRPFALITGDGVEQTFATGTEYLKAMEAEFAAAIDKGGFWESNQKTFEGWQAKLVKVGTNQKAIADFARVGKEITETVFLLQTPTAG